MSHHQSLSATHLLPCPAVVPKQASKRFGPRPNRTGACSPGRSSIHARVSSGHVATMEQSSVRRLVSYVTKKKVAGCALAVAGSLIWFLMPFGKDFALVDLLSEQGYWETIPPAEYYLPGTINTIEVRSNGKIAIYPTCKIDSELLAKMTLHSQTVDRTLAERLNKRFDV